MSGLSPYATERKREAGDEKSNFDLQVGGGEAEYIQADVEGSKPKQRQRSKETRPGENIFLLELKR